LHGSAHAAPHQHMPTPHQHMPRRISTCPRHRAACWRRRQQRACRACWTHIATHPHGNPQSLRDEETSTPASGKRATMAVGVHAAGGGVNAKEGHDAAVQPLAVLQQRSALAGVHARRQPRAQTLNPTTPRGGAGAHGQERLMVAAGRTSCGTQAHRRCAAAAGQATRVRRPPRLQQDRRRVRSAQRECLPMPCGPAKQNGHWAQSPILVREAMGAGPLAAARGALKTKESPASSANTLIGSSRGLSQRTARARGGRRRVC
jgi:hypothetical protein